MPCNAYNSAYLKTEIVSIKQYTGRGGMRIKTNLVILLSLAVLAGAGNCMGQGNAVLIGENTVMFVPEDFQAEAHLPSFALEKEPVVLGPAPEQWNTRVRFGRAVGRSMAYIEIDEDTDLYGTGEVTGPLVRNGTTRQLYNLDNYTFQRERGLRLYQSHPWVLGVRADGTAFGVLADNTWKQEISCGSGILFTSWSEPFRVIIIERSSPGDVMKALAGLTGTMPLPPLWSLGYHQCRWSYYPDTRARQVADTFRAKQIPCDVIWFDIHYMDGYRIFTFSSEYFPEPAQTNTYLHDRGFKTVWMIDPGVKNEPGYTVFDSGTKNDVWVKKKDGENFTGPVWPGPCVFPDFTMPETQKWWAGLYKTFMKQGIDGVWNDMNEPAVFNAPGWTMPDDNTHRGGGGLPGDVHLRYHNVYGMLMVKASRTGIKKANPDKRPFVLSRANYLGGHRYAATWTGDNASTWGFLKTSIPMSLNLSLSGQPFNGPDIGGFAGNATPELFAHWIAVGAFYPFCRAHSSDDTKDHEPWSFGKDTEDAARRALNRRYRLLPYIYTLFREASQTGMPVMRPVFFADPADRSLRAEQEAFLLGADLLVIPRWAEDPALPKGAWRNLDIDEQGQADDGFQPMLKIRPGAVIPVSTVIQNTQEYSLKTLDLFVCLDENGSARGVLYHDEGDGYGYTKGKYSETEFLAETENSRVYVRARMVQGSYRTGIETLRVHVLTDSGVKTVISGYAAETVIDL